MVFSVASSIYNAPSIYESGAGGGSGNEDYIGGRLYSTVKIAGKTWLAENLDYKFNGLKIGGTKKNEICALYYNNDEAENGIEGIKKRGLLYNYKALFYIIENAGVLFPGWHIPTLDDYNNLWDAIGSNVSGKKLKVVDGSVSANWPSNWNGTNDYGFSVIPTGFYDFSSGVFSNGDSLSVFWTSTQNSQFDNRTANYDSSDSAYSSVAGSSRAFAIRLIKD